MNDFFAVLMLVFFAALFHAGWKAAAHSSPDDNQSRPQQHRPTPKGK